MSLNAYPRLFVAAPLAPEAKLTLSRGQSHYLVNVMRRGRGDNALLFNGRDGEWQAVIDEANPRACSLRVVALTRPQAAGADIWLLFAPIKRQRIDLMAEKATELGVRVLQPVITERTIVTRLNVARLRAHAIEAAEQCGLLCVPELREACPLGQILERWPKERRLLFCDEGGAARPMLDALQAAAKGPWALLIGPEGGFSARERTELRAHRGVIAVSLGPRLLRADTAAVAALALWQAVLGDWGEARR